MYVLPKFQFYNCMCQNKIPIVSRMNYFIFRKLINYGSQIDKYMLNRIQIQSVVFQILRSKHVLKYLLLMLNLKEDLAKYSNFFNFLYNSLNQMYYFFSYYFFTYSKLMFKSNEKQF